MSFFQLPASDLQLPEPSPPNTPAATPAAVAYSSLPRSCSCLPSFIDPLSRPSTSSKTGPFPACGAAGRTFWRQQATPPTAPEPSYVLPFVSAFPCSLCSTIFVRNGHFSCFQRKLIVNVLAQLWNRHPRPSQHFWERPGGVSSPPRPSSPPPK